MSDEGPAENFSITRVPETLVGHWTDAARTTGTTVLLFPRGARCGAMLLGSASGTRELGVFDPGHLASRVHGMCFSGGSAFGLAAADGVMEFLAGRGIGFDSGYGRVPIVPAAILFDLPVASSRPNSEAGRSAAAAATSGVVVEGRVGAGAGATVAKWGGRREPGGLGSLSRDTGEWVVGALAVVNAFGSVRDPERTTWVAGDGGGDTGPPDLGGDWSGNTTLVAVATNAPLDGVQATTLARMASAGVARTIYPAYTPFDGDGVFAFSTGDGERVSLAMLAHLGSVAATLVAGSILRAVTAPGSQR